MSPEDTDSSTVIVSPPPRNVALSASTASKTPTAVAVPTDSAPDSPISISDGEYDSDAVVVSSPEVMGVGKHAKATSKPSESSAIVKASASITTTTTATTRTTTTTITTTTTNPNWTSCIEYVRTY
jgi:hypothetical protein